MKFVSRWPREWSGDAQPWRGAVKRYKNRACCTVLCYFVLFHAILCCVCGYFCTVAVLTMVHLIGEGCTQDTARAYGCFKQAAEAGNDLGQVCFYSSSFLHSK